MKKLIPTIISMIILSNTLHAQYSSINVGILPFSGQENDVKKDRIVSELSDRLSKYKFIKGHLEKPSENLTN